MQLLHFLTPSVTGDRVPSQLSVLQTIHAKKYVYRDIKPDNFMFGHGTQHENTVYIIDLGCMEREHMYNGMRQAANENGTPKYFSLNTHNQKRASDVVRLVMCRAMFGLPGHPHVPCPSAVTTRRHRRVGVHAGRAL